MILQGTKKYPVREVVLHTAATPGSWAVGKTLDEMTQEIRRWHVVDNGWKDIGYHRVFGPLGDTCLGRSLWTIGSHVRGHNAGTIGLCLIPIKTITKMGEPEDYYTPDQINTVKEYIRELSELTDIQKVSGHNEYAAKLCPGFIVKTGDWL
jgi:hypothetical protein